MPASRLLPINIAKPSNYPSILHISGFCKVHLHHSPTRRHPWPFLSRTKSEPYWTRPTSPIWPHWMPAGSPQSVPIWVGREGDRILICTGEGSLKAKNTRRDPRVSLSIVDFHDPFKEAQLRGRVIERRPDGDCKYIDPISVKYTGKPFPFRSPEGRVALVIEIEKARYTKLPFEHTPPKL